VLSWVSVPPAKGGLYTAYIGRIYLGDYNVKKFNPNTFNKKNMSLSNFNPFLLAESQTFDSRQILENFARGNIDTLIP